MIRKSIVTLCLVLMGTVLWAQEFWLQPEKFVYAIKDTVNVNFVWGKNFREERWTLRTGQVNRLEHYHAGQMDDLRSLEKPGDRRQISFVARDAGTHLLVMQSNNQARTLPADTFNVYLKAAGQDDALSMREANGTLRQPVEESFAFCSKLYLRAGVDATGSYKKIAGMPLEIIAGNNPTSLRTGDVLHCKIVWQGKPLFGARVKVWNRKDNRTLLQNIYTEKTGTIRVPIGSGTWMISVLQTTPIKGAANRWQTYWSSIVFQVD